MSGDPVVGDAVAGDRATGAPGAVGVPAAAPAPLSFARRTFAALAHRDYRLFFLGMGVSSMGTWGRHAAQGWLVRDLTGDPRWWAWSAAGSLFLVALVSLPGGVLADRVNKRRLLFALQAAAMLLGVAMAVLVGSGRATPATVVALSCGFGVIGGLEMPCRQAFVAELVGRDTLRNAIALNSLMFNLPLVLGPAVAAVLVDTLGLASVFAFDAATYAASLWAYGRIRAGARPLRDAADRAGREARPLHELTTGFRFVLSHAPSRTVVLLLACAMVFGWSYTSLLPAFARDVLGADARAYNVLYLSSGVGACAGALWAASRRPTRALPLLALALGGFLVSYVGLALARTLPLAMGSRALAGASMITFFATASAALQEASPDAIRSRVMSVWTFTFALSLPSGQVLLGELCRHRSVPETYLLGALLLTLSAGAVLWIARRGAASGARRRS